MNYGDAIICILFTAFAASYGWGMRGSLIGGEKGAMLPGAFIGLTLGRFSGLGSIGTAAAGLIGMTFGGTETYGETIGMVLHRGREDYNPVRGYIGLAYKGGLWFAVCGGFIGLSLSYGVYPNSDIFIFCLLIPVMQIVGQLIFNRPYKPEKNKYPKIYFSKTRREEWGGNLFMLISMVIMAELRDDHFTVIMIAGGFIFGAVGWLVAMRAYVAAVFPMKNGKYLFGKLYHKGLIDGWKLMEFILGAFGGFGLSLAFCLGYDYIEIYKERASYGGVGFADEYIDGWVPVLCLFCLAGIFAVNLIAFVCDKKGINLNSFVLDHVERPFYNVIPLMFVLVGHGFAERFMSAFMLVFAVINKLLFDRFKKVNIVTLLAAAAACGAAYMILMNRSISAFDIIIAGTVPYIAGELIWMLSKQGRHGKSIKEMLTKTSLATVFPSFVVMSLIIIIISYKIFVF